MSTLAVGTIKSVSSSPPTFQNTSGTEKGQLVGAWCNFSGSGTPSYNADFNCDGISDNGTGRYTVIFTNSFADGNYCVAGTHNSFSNGVSCIGQDGSNTTNSGRYSMLTTVDNAVTDPSEVRLIFTGNL